MPPIFFATPADLRGWFQEHHATARELLVGYHRKGAGKPTLTWQQSVDEALCVGWIDGVRQGVDKDRFTVRFTPRQRASIWSAVNLARVGVLAAENRLQPAGVAAFEARREDRSGIYSYEQRRDRFDPPEEAIFRGDRAAWEFFERQPPSYRRKFVWWVVSARREATRHRRLEKLMAESREGRRIP